MRKQFVMAIAALTLSTVVVGCSSKAPTSSEMNTEASSTPEEKQPTTEESTSEPESSIVPEESIMPEETVKPEATTKPEESVTPEASTSPEATKKPETASKPQTSLKPEATAKPQATPKPSPKPEASTKPAATPKPEVIPKPEPIPSPETTSLSASEVYSKITSDLDFSRLTDVDDTLLKDLYGIDTSLLDSYCVKMPMLSFSISEVGVFKVKDVKDVNTIVEGINKRAENVGQMLYPSLIETFEGRQVITKGNYILFAMDEAASTIASNFNSLIK